MVIIFWGSHSGCPFVVLEVVKLKTVAVEKARENFEKAKEKAEALRAKLDAAEKHLKRLNIHGKPITMRALNMNSLMLKLGCRCLNRMGWKNDSRTD